MAENAGDCFHAFNDKTSEHPVSQLMRFYMCINMHREVFPDNLAQTRGSSIYVVRGRARQRKHV